MNTRFKNTMRLLAALCLLPALAACGAKESGAPRNDADSSAATAGKHPADRPAPEVAVDLGRSDLYTEKERNDAMLAVKRKFATFAGCELHGIRYAGDEACSEENLKWLNSLDEGAEYTQVAEFLTDFHSPVEDGPYAWERDMEYTDYQWWLARKEDGDWVLVSWGY